MANLHSLTILRGTIDGELLRNIADIGTVRKLRLIFTKIGDDFLDGLAEFTSLEHLEMNPNSLDWDELQELSLVHTQVLGHGLAHLARLPKLREMLIMADAHHMVPDLAGLQHLPHLERLQILGLGLETSLPR